MKRRERMERLGALQGRVRRQRELEVAEASRSLEDAEAVLEALLREADTPPDERVRSAGMRREEGRVAEALRRTIEAARRDCDQRKAVLERAQARLRETKAEEKGLERLGARLREEESESDRHREQKNIDEAARRVRPLSFPSTTEHP